MTGFEFRIKRWSITGNVAGCWYLKPWFGRQLSAIPEENEAGWQRWTLFWLHCRVSFEWWVPRKVWSPTFEELYGEKP